VCDLQPRNIPRSIESNNESLEPNGVEERVFDELGSTVYMDIFVIVSVLAITGPVRSSDAKLRRAQALAHHSGASLRISRELVLRKLTAQEQVAREKLLDCTTADQIVRFKSELPTADNISSIRLIEAQAARAYWSAWSTLPINFPKNDKQRIPDHWCSFGARVSPLTGSLFVAWHRLKL